MELAKLEDNLDAEDLQRLNKPQQQLKAYYSELMYLEAQSTPLASYDADDLRAFRADLETFVRLVQKTDIFRHKGHKMVGQLEAWLERSPVPTEALKRRFECLRELDDIFRKHWLEVLAEALMKARFAPYDFEKMVGMGEWGRAKKQGV
jgi:hypothetical protein